MNLIGQQLYVAAIVELRIKPLRPNARIPTRMSSGGAGYDLYAAQDAEVPAASTTSKGGVDVGRCLVPVGFAIELPAETVGRVATRSGLSVKSCLAALLRFTDCRSLNPSQRLSCLPPAAKAP